MRSSNSGRSHEAARKEMGPITVPVGDAWVTLGFTGRWLVDPDSHDAENKGAWRRLLTARSARAAAALQRVVPRGDAALAGRETGAVGTEPAAAEHAGLAASPR